MLDDSIGSYLTVDKLQKQSGNRVTRVLITSGNELFGSNLSIRITQHCIDSLVVGIDNLLGRGF